MGVHLLISDIQDSIVYSQFMDENGDISHWDGKCMCNI